MSKTTLVVEKRNTLYFGKFKYRIEFKGRYDLGSGIMNRRPPRSGSVRERILEWIKPRKLSNQIDVRCAGLKLSVYSNSLQDLEDCAVIVACHTPPVITEASDIAPPGVMLFSRQPKFKYRVYLKEKRTLRSELEELATILDRNEGRDFKPSPLLRRRLNSEKIYGFPRNYMYVYSSMYFEFNDEMLLTYLALRLDNDILGKKFKLEKRT